MKQADPEPVHLCDYAPPAFSIDAVELHFDLDEAVTRVRSKLSMRRNSEVTAGDAPLVLDGEALMLDRLALDGRTLGTGEYRIDESSLTLPRVPVQFELEIETRIEPRENTALEGLYLSGGMLCTQCEAEGFRRITYFPDRPDVMAAYTVTLAADKASYPVLLANGDCIARGDLGDGRHYATWRDPYRKPSYLFALVAGDLACVEDRHTTRSGRTVALRLYVQHHNTDQCAHALISLKKAMRWDEETYGLEYDLDTYMIVAVDDFNMGAMENKGLNLFNSKYVLARPETATDEDYADIEAVIGHEYFHNWTGNRVTCRDWFQLSLKEGLTVFREQQFAADVGSAALRRIEDVRLLRSRQFAEDASPMAHPVRPQSYLEINNFYTATVYEKGAELVRMIHTLVSQDGFRRGLRLYLERFDGRAATVDNFIAAMADANGIDLEQFKRWYDQAGTPEVDVAGAWDADGKTYRLRVRQISPPAPGREDNKPFHIPLAVGLLAPDGAELTLQLEGEDEPQGTRRVLEVTAPKQQFIFIKVPAKPTPSLLRDFSAPVKLNFDYSDEGLAFLLANDPDPFNRWDAGQRLAIKLMRRLIVHYRQDRALRLDPRLIETFAALLNDASADPALVAEALTPPTETELSGVMDEIDVDAIHAVHQFMQRALASALESRWLNVYESSQFAGGLGHDAAGAAKRRLRNLCLGFLTALPDADYRELALEQFNKAGNMTDAMGALWALNDRECPQRAAALQAFHDRWRRDSLVMDKWFTLQASSRLPGTLTTVKNLIDHPLFSLKNPNKVRALLGAFANRNPGAFHQPSGEGYSFIASQVLRLDAFNPQIAARLAGAFSRWRHYDTERRALMCAQLQRIADSGTLSKNLREVVSKSLG